MSWIKLPAEVHAAVKLLLNIVRNGSEPKEMVAEKGFYHETLDHRIPCQLVRIVLPKKVELLAICRHLSRGIAQRRS
jgi:cell division FtsZ-interacting protein ZapD